MSELRPRAVVPRLNVVRHLTASSQRDHILDDWATGDFTPATLAAKYKIAVSSIMGNIIQRARSEGDPRAKTMKELADAKTPKAEAKPKSPSLAETFGIRPGRLIEIGEQAGGRVNRITLSGGLVREARSPLEGNQP